MHPGSDTAGLEVVRWQRDADPRNRLAALGVAHISMMGEIEGAIKVGHEQRLLLRVEVQGLAEVLGKAEVTRVHGRKARRVIVTGHPPGAERPTGLHMISEERNSLHTALEAHVAKKTLEALAKRRRTEHDGGILDSLVQVVLRRTRDLQSAGEDDTKHPAGSKPKLT